jgi:hypothetical protein
MDSTCGSGKLPLVQDERDLGLARLFDVPIEMEKIPHAYAWPYHHNDGVGDYHFLTGGRRAPNVRFARARRVAKPFPHFEPGSWNRILGSEPYAGRWLQWGELVQDSRKAIASRKTGEFSDLTSTVAELRKYCRAARAIQSSSFSAGR